MSRIPALLAVAGLGAIAVAASRRGSRSVLSAADFATLARVRSQRPRGSRASLLELSKAAPQEAIPQQQGRHLGTTRVKVNEGAMWKLAAEKLYGDYVDVPVVATREALQNSWDAIDEAVRAGMLPSRAAGRFDVTWGKADNSLCWADNGIGMSEETVDRKFLSLGDTSKIATMGRGDMQRGGFGIAKAILLGASSTFTWTLHTRNRIFTSTDFHADIAIQVARPRQGVALKVVNIDKRHLSQYRVINGEYTTVTIPERLVYLLSTCAAPFPITLDGHTVEPAFSGPGAVLAAEGANWGNGVTGRVRAFTRSTPGGRLVLRLGGLTQFWRDIASGASMADVVVDLDTDIRPTEQGYPVTASRMALSGPAEASFSALLEELNVDTLSATKGTEAEEVDDLPSEGIVNLNRAQVAALAQLADRDPALRAIFAKIKGLGELLQAAARQQVDERAREQDSPGRSTAGDLSKPFVEMAKKAEADLPPEPESESEKREVQRRERGQAAAEAERLRRDALRGAGFVNPFAGAGRLEINRGQWSKERLKPYLDKPAALVPLLFAWRTALSMAMANLYLGKFEVGFVFDDRVRASFSPGKRLYLVNPVPVVKIFQALPKNPEVIAAYLHGKACHEVTHGRGYGEHDERFVATYEDLLEKTVLDVDPLTRVVALSLGMSTPGTAKSPRAPASPRVPRIQVSNGRIDSDDMQAFVAGVKTLLEHAGYPVRVEYDGSGGNDGVIRALVFNSRSEDDERIRVDLNRGWSSPSRVEIDGRYTTFSRPRFEVRDLLSPVERKVDEGYSTQTLDISPRVVKAILARFREEKMRPLTTEERAGAGSLNRALDRRALRGLRERAERAISGSVR